MKYIILVLLLVISTDWTETSQPQLHSLGSAIDSRVYWAGLRRTTDGGVTWQRLNTGLQPLPFSFLKTYFLNHKRGWIVSARDGTYQTEDGGEHWQRVLAESAITIIFADDLNGWLQTISSNGGTYYHTQDGGRTWSRCGQGISLKSVSYPDSNYIYGVSEDRQVFRSTDGGCNFSQWRAGYYLVSFSSADRGVVVESTKIVYIEAEQQLEIELPEEVEEVYSAYFLNSRRGWILVLPEDESDSGMYEWSDGSWRKIAYRPDYVERFLTWGWKDGALQMLLMGKSVNLSL